MKIPLEFRFANQFLLEAQVSLVPGITITFQLCRVMRDVGKNLGIPLHVFGPETHMTAIVGMALGKRSVPAQVAGADQSTTANFLLPSSVSCTYVYGFRASQSDICLINCSLIKNSMLSRLQSLPKVS